MTEKFNPTNSVESIPVEDLESDESLNAEKKEDVKAYAAEKGIVISDAEAQGLVGEDRIYGDTLESRESESSVSEARFLDTLKNIENSEVDTEVVEGEKEDGFFKRVFKKAFNGTKEILLDKDKRKEAFEAVKNVVTNREVQKQALKTVTGVVSSIVGVKSLYTVPAYLKQKVGASKDKRDFKQIMREMVDYDEITEVDDWEKGNESEIGFGRGREKKIGEIMDLGKYEDLEDKIEAMDISESEKDNMMQEMNALVENYKKEVESLQDGKNEKLNDTLGDYVKTKISGIEAVKETLNSACKATMMFNPILAAGAYGARVGSYTILDGVNRFKKMKADRKEEAKNARLGEEAEGVKVFKDVIAGSMVDTVKGLALSDDGGKKDDKEIAMNFLKSAGSVAKFMGIARYLPDEAEVDGEKVIKAMEAMSGGGEEVDQSATEVDQGSVSPKVPIKGVASDGIRDFDEQAAIAYEGGESDSDQLGLESKPLQNNAAPSGVTKEGVNKMVSPVHQEGENKVVLPGEPGQQVDGINKVTASGGDESEIIKPVQPVKEGEILEGEKVRLENVQNSSEVFKGGVLKAEKGDDLWKMTKKFLDANDKLEGLDKEQRTLLIDAVKDQMVEVLENPDNIEIGQEIDFASNLHMPQVDLWVDEACEADPEKLASIKVNNEKLEKFFEDHEDAPRSSENYKAILEGKGVTGEEIPVVVEPQEEAEKVAAAVEEVKEEAKEIYKFSAGPFGGSQIEEWNVVKNIPAQEALAGKFGEHVGDQLDQVEINNREELQGYLKKATELIGEPGRGENVATYLQRYELTYGGVSEMNDIGEDVGDVAQNHVNEEVNSIYEGVIFDSHEEWEVVKDKNAGKVLSGNFGEHFEGNSNDTNREQIQEYLNKAKDLIGEPEGDENVDEFLSRYEQSIIDVRKIAEADFAAGVTEVSSAEDVQFNDVEIKAVSPGVLAKLQELKAVIDPEKNMLTLGESEPVKFSHDTKTVKFDLNKSSGFLQVNVLNNDGARELWEYNDTKWVEQNVPGTGAEITEELVPLGDENAAGEVADVEIPKVITETVPGFDESKVAEQEVGTSVKSDTSLETSAVETGVVVSQENIKNLLEVDQTVDDKYSDLVKMIKSAGSNDEFMKDFSAYYEGVYVRAGGSVEDGVEEIIRDAVAAVAAGDPDLSEYNAEKTIKALIKDIANCREEAAAEGINVVGHSNYNDKPGVLEKDDLGISGPVDIKTPIDDMNEVLAKYGVDVNAVDEAAPSSEINTEVDQSGVKFKVPIKGEASDGVRDFDEQAATAYEGGESDSDQLGTESEPIQGDANKTNLPPQPLKEGEVSSGELARQKNVQDSSVIEQAVPLSNNTVVESGDSDKLTETAETAPKVLNEKAVTNESSGIVGVPLAEESDEVMQPAEAEKVLKETQEIAPDATKEEAVEEPIPEVKDVKTEVEDVEGGTVTRTEANFVGGNINKLIDLSAANDPGSVMTQVRADARVLDGQLQSIADAYNTGKSQEEINSLVANVEGIYNQADASYGEGTLKRTSGVTALLNAVQEGASDSSNVSEVVNNSSEAVQFADIEEVKNQAQEVAPGVAKEEAVEEPIPEVKDVKTEVEDVEGGTVTRTEANFVGGNINKLIDLSAANDPGSVMTQVRADARVLDGQLQSIADAYNTGKSQEEINSLVANVEGIYNQADASYGEGTLKRTPGVTALLDAVKK